MTHIFKNILAELAGEGDAPPSAKSRTADTAALPKELRYLKVPYEFMLMRPIQPGETLLEAWDEPQEALMRELDAGWEGTLASMNFSVRHRPAVDWDFLGSLSPRFAWLAGSPAKQAAIIFGDRNSWVRQEVRKTDGIDALSVADVRIGLIACEVGLGVLGEVLAMVPDALLTRIAVSNGVRPPRETCARRRRGHTAANLASPIMVELTHCPPRLLRRLTVVHSVRQVGGGPLLPV